MTPKIAQWLHYERIAVTGGQGGIGRRLVRELILGGAQRIVVLDRSPLKSRGMNLSAGRVRQIQADLLDFPRLKKALSDCTTVFHLAALTHAGESEQQPLRYLEANGWGAAQLLEACRQLRIRRVLYTSSALVYGRVNCLPVKETQPAQPLSVYAVSKLLGEEIFQGYAAAYGFSNDVARLSNVYGAAANPASVIGSALKQAVSGRGTLRLRNFDDVRDFIHADDVVEALLRLAAAGARPGCRILNVSTGRGVSVRMVAQTLARISQRMGMGKLAIQQKRGPRGEVSKLVLDNTRLRRLTGWKPVISLETGLTRAWEEWNE